MNPKRWTPPVSPALIVALAGLTVATTAARAQSAPAVDAATLAKYDANHNGVLDPNELAAMQADQAKATAPVAASTSSSSGADVVQLSPFQVDASKDRGYFAENTLAGSRMKTNLADLGASISIVNKAMMEDTASFDINDIFRYEANTEGASTYTPNVQAFRNDGVLDVNAGGTQGNSVSSFTVSGANRVRGMSAPSSSTNYFPSISAVPPDRYNVQSFEVTRGPNALLFGLGSPSGVVNQTTSQAVLNRDSNRAEATFDDRGSYRGSLAFNRALIKDKLAVYGAGLYRNDQFIRKPSFDITRRAYGAITIKPTSKTVIRADIEAYSNYNRRPNTLSPTDLVTQWKLAGSPVYDSLNKTFTFQANGPFGIKAGTVKGPYILESTSMYAQQTRNYITSLPGYDPTLIGGPPTGQAVSTSNFTTYGGTTIFGQNAVTTLPYTATGAPATSVLVVPGVAELTQSRTIQQLHGGNLYSWFQPLYNTTYTTGWGFNGNPAANVPASPSSTAGAAVSLATVRADPLLADVYNRDFYASSGWTNIASLTKLGNYRYPEVTDRSIYDWKKVNTLSSNFGKQRNTSYHVELEQELAKNLFLYAGWFRQEFDQQTNYTIAQLNAVALRVDVNKYLPDGTPNPFFQKVYVNDFDPDRYINAELDDHFRVNFAYTPDFTRKNNWMHWLGRHQILGAWSEDYSLTTSYRQRMNWIAAGDQATAFRYLPNPNNDASGNPTGWHYTNGTSGIQRNFYLEGPNDPNATVTQGSGEWNALTYSGNVRVFNYQTKQFENAPVTQSFINFDSPGQGKRILQSYTIGDTSYLWKDRIVLTVGDRFDKLKLRSTTTGAITDPVTGAIYPALTNPQKFDSNGYVNTAEVLNRWDKPTYFRFHTKTAGGVFRPFRSWEAVESRAGSGNQFWQLIRDFGLSYNYSTNNDIPGSDATDGFGVSLPKPGGVGRDYGFQASMLDNKLFAKITWFKSSNINQRVSPTTTIGRLTSNIDTTLFRSWARTIALINAGQDPTAPATTFDPGSGGPGGQQFEDQIEAATAKIWGMPYDYYSSTGRNIGATQDSTAKGMEATLSYNSGGWRNRITFGKQETINSNVLKQFDSWYAYRSPLWLSAKASDYLLPQYQKFLTYTASGGTPVDLTTFWLGYGWNSAVRINDAFGNTNVSNYYGINVTPQVSLAKDLNGQASPGQRKYRWAYNTGYDFRTGRLAGWSVGGAERWESKSIIGYAGKSSHGNTSIPDLLDISDTTKPYYDKANWYTDLFIRYRTKVYHNRMNMTVQLNVANVFENGHLQFTATNYDGTPYAYRIIDPRQFQLTTTFDF